MDKNNMTDHQSLPEAKFPQGPRRKLTAGVVGATGYVGQRFMQLLADHPWFEIKKIAASPRSAGKSYAEAVEGRWHLHDAMPAHLHGLILENLHDVAGFCTDLDLVFCAVDMPKDEIIALEEAIARQEVPVISNNSANRTTPDVPILIPEINPHHIAVLDKQKERLGTERGFIVCKPNCSIQSYVPPLHALKRFGLEAVIVSTYQAVSGAGKTLDTWPEMRENVIPYIGGEEEKSETEPLKLWGTVQENRIVSTDSPVISAHCYRVAVPEGHTAAVSVRLNEQVSADEIMEAWSAYNPLQGWNLPSAPEKLLTYHHDKQRPQPVLDAESEGGMAVHIGRLREDPVLDWKFVCLSHNTLRGAAGGAVLSAEFLTVTGHIEARNL